MNLKTLASTILLLFFYLQLLYAQHGPLSASLNDPYNNPSKRYLGATNKIPDCTAPTNLRAIHITDDEITIVWNGTEAEPGSIKYEVRYRDVLSSNWLSHEVVRGKSAILGIATQKTEIIIQVRKVCFWKDESPVYSDWINTTVINQTAESTSGCGDLFTYPSYPCEASDRITNPNFVFDEIYIGGFGIEIDSISSSYNVENQLVWSGFGIIDLPFGQQSVRVEWSNVYINNNYNICGGTVRGISDDPVYQPSFAQGPIPFNGQICITPPSEPGFDANGIHSVTGLPWDENGFGPDGKFVKQPPYPGYQPGDPIDSLYDPNGFDANGYYLNTGSIYNPDGCNREGLTANGDTCNPNVSPYSWLDPDNPNPPTQSGIAFAAEIKDSIDIWITQILNDLLDENELKKDSQLQVCDSIRTEMNATLQQTGLNRQLTFGPNDDYFKVGMHANFSAPPTNLLVNMQRNQHVKSLEYQHIDLYQCDKRQFVFQHFMDVIQDFLGSGLNNLSVEIITKIKALPESTIQAFENDPAVFQTWLFNEIDRSVDEEYVSQFGSYSNIETNTSHKNYKDIASLSLDPSNDTQLIWEAGNISLEDVLFEYHQGFKEVYGVHRAYYMDALVKARDNSSKFLTLHDPLLMPIDVTNRGSDGKLYRVYLDDIKFYPNRATMDVFVVIETPFDGQTLVFESQDITFTPFGPLTPQIHIQLDQNVPVRLSNNARLELIAGVNTYVSFNCNGFNGIGIEANVELCRNIVKPYDPVNDVVIQDPERVNGNILVVMPNFSDFYVEFSMDPFVVTNYEDFKWLINGIVIDQSESKSPTGAPPIGYQTPFAGSSGFSNAWKGFYADTLQLRMPRMFNSGGAPLTISVYHLLIDNMGVSGSLSADNILSINAGSAGGWPFSVDHFGLTVLMNQFANASFRGLVNVPIMRGVQNTTGSFSVSDCLSYSAFIKPGNAYAFSLTPFTSDYSVDIWKAGVVTIARNSTISMEYKNGDFTAIANLSGSAQINGELVQNVGIEIPTITFQNVEISNKAPYFSPGVWGFPNSVGAKFAGFELTLDSIKMVDDGNGNPALNFDIFIQITDSKIGLSGKGGFKIIGELADDNGRQRWKYKEFGMRDVYINGGFSGVTSIVGFVKFFENDGNYGTGFKGGLNAKFEFIKKDITVVGQFGKMPNYKYFFVDALFCGDIPMVGPLSVQGIGGGVYYNMQIDSGVITSLPVCTTAGTIPTEIGVSQSGIKYSPYQGKHEFRFIVAFGLNKAKRAFNANASLMASFFQGGGINSLIIEGNARIMEEKNIQALPSYITGAAPSNGAGFSANVRLAFEFAKREFSGNLEVYADIVGVIKGDEQYGNLVVNTTVFFSETNWYIHVGSPPGSGKPSAKLSIFIPPFGKLATANGYFQIGNKIDPMPSLPELVSRLVGDSRVTKLEEFQDPKRDANANYESGFAFGVRVTIDKHFKFLVFYADLEAVAGFDVGMYDNGNTKHCAGSSDPIGINGWYAKGQVFAGIDGDIGMRVKVFGSTKEFSIMRVGGAIALQAQLPNPFWAKGSFGVEYSILNGLIKGKNHFQLEIGERCTIVGDDPFLDVPIINYTTPSNEQEEVDPAIFPSVSFNFPINKSFSFQDLNNNNTNYTVSLKEIKLTWRNTYDIPFDTVFISENLIRLEPQYFLPGNDTFQLKIVVSVDSNSIQVMTEERVSEFTTGEGISVILPSNVEGAYPFDGQYNLYKEDVPNGYIQLFRGQPDVFFEKEGYQKMIRFRQPNGNCISTPLNINPENYFNNRIEFELPTTFLQNEEIYQFQVLEFPIGNSSFGSGFSSNDPCVGNNFNLTSRPLANNAGILAAARIEMPPLENVQQPTFSTPPPTEKVLYNAYFRVSQYNTMMAKLDALATEQTSYRTNGALNASMHLRTPDPESWEKEFDVYTNIEPFDNYELRKGGLSVGAYILQEGSSGVHWINKAGTDYSMLLLEQIKPFNAQLKFSLQLIGGNAETESVHHWVYSGVKIFSTNNIQPPIISESDYLSGNDPGENIEQKISFFAPKILKTIHDHLYNEAVKHKNNNDSLINNYYQCDPWATDYCLLYNACSGPWGLDEPLTEIQKHLLTAGCGYGPVTGEPTFPVIFIYKIPAWQHNVNQTTAVRTFNLKQ